MANVFRRDVGIRPNLKSDVRLVYAQARGQYGLVRGRQIIFLPREVCQALFHAGADRFGSDLMELLEANGFVTSKADPTLENDRTRNFLDTICDGSYARVASALERLSFLILGCGGLGSQIAFMLASLGAKRLMLADSDLVEPSNLNRLFWADYTSIGRPKAAAMAEALKRRYDVAVEVHPNNADGAWTREVRQNPELLDSWTILTLDGNAAARQIVSELHRTFTGPYLQVGYTGAECVVGPAALAATDPCPFCRSSALRFEGDRQFIAPSVLPNNALTGGFAVTQIARLLQGLSSPVHQGVWQFNIAQGTSVLTRAIKQEDCTVCNTSG